MGTHSDHAGHSHAISSEADQRWLSLALALILCFMFAEVFAGLIAHSLALLSDAAHMLTDAAAIALAIGALRLSQKPATGNFTFGLKRLEILSAQANGITLFLLGAWLTYSAVHRLISPEAVHGLTVVVASLAGAVVNVGAAMALAKANRKSLNIEGAYQHVLTDLIAFIATAIAGVIVIATGFERADAIATLFIVVMMFKSAYSLTRESGRIFMEAAPSGVNANELGAELVQRPNVVEIHDLHLWQITSGQPAMSAHVLARDDADCHAVRRDLEEILHNTYEITHTTLQVDHYRNDENCGDDHGEDSHGVIHRAHP